ncbi:MAG: hypothetical protein Q8754_02595, partial [Sweet potato little leaf phytoplasma]|nr:hypothetical protein [Sweet potato little leaf phytoplasma]
CHIFSFGVGTLTILVGGFGNQLVVFWFYFDDENQNKQQEKEYGERARNQIARLKNERLERDR